MVVAPQAPAHDHVGHVRSVGQLELAGRQVVFAGGGTGRVFLGRPGHSPRVLFKPRGPDDRGRCDVLTDVRASGQALAVRTRRSCFIGTGDDGDYAYDRQLLVAGPLLGPYRTVQSCPQRHSDEPSFDIDVAGSKLAFQRFGADCAGTTALVVRDAVAHPARGGRVVRIGERDRFGDSLQLAGRLLAVDNRLYDWRRGAALYDLKGGYVDDLARDGRAAVTAFRIVGDVSEGTDFCDTERVGVAGPPQGELEWTGPAIDCDVVPAFTALAGGRLAYGSLEPRQHEPDRDQRHVLVLDDLAGHRRALARFPRGRDSAPITSSKQAFDGRNLAYTVRRCDGTEDVWLDDVDRDPAFVDRAPLRCAVRAGSGTAYVDDRGRTRLPIVCPEGCVVENRGFQPSRRRQRLRYDLNRAPSLLRRIRREHRVRASLSLEGYDRAFQDIRLRRTFTFAERG